jgi:ectoine hydroxylase-related dioxygenase (phytanoyl-CoA dioxygenase family)
LKTARTAEATENGFAILHDVVAEAEVLAMFAALTVSGIPRSRAGARYLMRVPAVASLAQDPRLVAIATSVLGTEAIPFGATLFDKSEASNWLVVWHQDTALPLRERRDVIGWGRWSLRAGVVRAHAPATALARVVALRVHLDDSTPSNGPLRVLPRSHVNGVLTDQQILKLARRVTPVECVAPRGSIVVMRPLLVHSSSKAKRTRPRRVLHLEYAASTELEGGLQLRVA